MQKLFKISFLPIFIIFEIFSTQHALAVDKDELVLTRTELDTLRLFKKKVSHVEAHDWLKSDLSLIRWLRRNRFDLDASEQAFKANLKWRFENSIDTILDEDWSYYHENYFMQENATDYEGRPVITADISEWNVREAVLSGKGDQLYRYMIRGIESAAGRIRDLQEQGFDVTQWLVILNMRNFNLVSHACFRCLPIYLRFITAHETYYPFGAKKIIVINTPSAFEVVLNLLRPVMSPEMKESLTVLGTNRAEWRKVVLSLVPEHQLAEHFGGSLKPTQD